MPETELYGPIKLFLEAQGYVVKGEIGACDVMAVRGDEGLVVVELKERLSLALILQAVDRLAFCDTVYVAFRAGKGHSASWRTRRKQVTRASSVASAWASSRSLRAETSFLCWTPHRIGPEHRLVAGSACSGSSRTGSGIRRMEAHPPGNVSPLTAKTRYDARESSRMRVSSRSAF